MRATGDGLKRINLADLEPAQFGSRHIFARPERTQPTRVPHRGIARSGHMPFPFSQCELADCALCWQDHGPQISWDERAVACIGRGATNVQAIFLVLMGSLCLIVALIEAWLLVVHFSSENNLVAKLIPGRQDLLRSHIDFLMMSQFQFIFYMLFSHFARTPPVWVVISVCAGSFFNPLAFLIRAIKPSFLKQPPAPFKAMLAVSCLATTAGYAASAWIFTIAAIATMVHSN